jgi:hypothetical protein
VVSIGNCVATGDIGYNPPVSRVPCDLGHRWQARHFNDRWGKTGTLLWLGGTSIVVAGVLSRWLKGCQARDRWTIYMRRFSL